MNQTARDGQLAAAGRYVTAAGEWSVTLEAVGEGCRVRAISAQAGIPTAIADDRLTVAALFAAPRAGADRYGDWGAFEWQTRLGAAPAGACVVWRVAEDRHQVAYLGMAAKSAGADLHLPLAAALWRGWGRAPGLDPRALFWHSQAAGHLWIESPFEMPRYIALGAHPDPEAVVCAITSAVRPERLVLECGGVDHTYWHELAGMFPGQLRPVEPFADVMVAPEVREALTKHQDPTVFLPAIGAARVLMHGAPPAHRLCESSPEHTAAGG
jgi:hypothetical protein